MEDRSKRSLLRLLILILTAMDQTTVISANPRGNHHHQESSKIDLSQALEKTTKFICKEPQWRAYNLRDLMQNVTRSSESANQPMYILVKRCDSHSGCCHGPDLSCAPEKSSIYYDEMEVEIWSLLTNSTKKIWIKVEQHARCKCQVSSASDRLTADIRPPDIQII